MRNIKVLLLLPIFAIFFTINAYAGTWIQDSKGWWYDQGNGTWPSNSWQWIDGNSDGTAECYYFDKFGYCMTNTITPDNYRVNASGAWIENNIVQTKKVDVADTRYTLLNGTIRVLKYNEVLAVQGINDPNPNSSIDRDKDFILFILDRPQTLTCKTIDGGSYSRTVKVLSLNYLPDIKAYNGQHVKAGFDLNVAYWPSDTSLPLGAPVINDMYIDK